MRGRLPARPLGEIADAAVRVFTAKGFRAAGISDVAAALGLSHGAVYTYADSKQALLYLALVRVLDPAGFELLEIPVTAPSAEEVVERVRTWAATQANISALGESLRHPRPGPSAAGSGARSPLESPLESAAESVVESVVEQELQVIVDALYGLLEHNRTALQLVEQCSAELPELAQWYFVENRRAVLALLGEFLRARIDAGLLPPVPNVPVAARFIVETIAWFAMHRHGDPDSAMLSDEDCRRTVRHLVPSAFLPPGSAPHIPT